MVRSQFQHGHFSLVRITITSRKRASNISGRADTGFLGNTNYENLAVSFIFAQAKLQQKWQTRLKI